MREGNKPNNLYNLSYTLYLLSLTYYTLYCNHDIPTHLIFFLSLISLTSIVPTRYHRGLHIGIVVVCVMDVVGKVLIVVEVVPGVGWVDVGVVQTVLKMEIGKMGYEILIYLVFNVLSWLLVCSFHPTTKTRTQTIEQYKFLQFLSSTLDYLTPLLLYSLCYTKLTNHSTFSQWIEHLSPELTQLQFQNIDMFEQVLWGLLSGLYMVYGKNKINVVRMVGMLVVAMVVRDHWQQYNGKEKVLYQLPYNIILAVKASLLIFLRVHNKANQYHLKVQQQQQISDRQHSTGSGSRISSHMRYAYRKKISQLQSINHIIVIIVLIITIITLCLTNGLGNVVAILAVATNFPYYVERKFRMRIAIGIIVSMLLQPQQFIYFLFLYFIRMFKTTDHAFGCKNWWILVQTARILILISKVSLLTFLIGLFQSPILVVLTLMFRTISSYYRLIIVFMGTDDNYNYLISNIVPNSLPIDILLWSYLILLKIYSHSQNIKFVNTDITNIFLEYAWIRHVEGGLKMLRIFHWIAYTGISLVILNSRPSLFTLCRIIPLVVVFTVGILESHRSKMSYYLWGWNLYTALIIAFVKYFYLLSQYSNLSPWLVSLLQPLQQNHKFIGLTPPDHTSLLVAFGPDVFLIVVNTVLMYIIKVQLSQVEFGVARERVIEENNLREALVENKGYGEGEEVPLQDKNIHYLYNKYIKPIDLRFRQTTYFTMLITDCILDLSFLIFLTIYYLLSSSPSLNYFPHFLLFFYGFIYQRGKHHAPHLFHILVAICSIDLVLIYLRYFLSLIQGNDIDYDMTTVISKYLLLIFAVVFQQMNTALQKYYLEDSQMYLQHSFLLFKMIAPNIPNEIYKKQVIILYLQLYKTLSLCFFLAELFSGSPQIQHIHFYTLVLMSIFLCFVKQGRKQFFKRHWMYVLIGCTLLDLYQGHLIDLLSLWCLRGYYIMAEEFDLHIFRSRYQRSNRTDNQENQRKVQEEDKRLQERFHFPKKSVLEIIEEANQKRQESHSQRQFAEQQWDEKNIFVTLVWLSPLFCILLILLGSLFYSQGPSGLSIFLLNFISLLLILNNLYNFTIQSKPVKVFMFLSVAALMSSLIYEVILGYHQYGLLNHFGVGLFFIFFGIFAYFQLLIYDNNLNVNKNLNYSYHITFCEKRSQEAIDYWKLKCQMVSQLGSQIHNQKKLTSLKLFFLHRENLAAKVQQLQYQLKFKSSHRKTRFEKLERIQTQEEQEMFKKGQFDVYSNMLTFMSLEDLQFCYLNLNQYYKNQDRIHDLAQNISNMRQWVLTHFRQSLAFTLKQYEKVQETSLSTIKILPILEESKSIEQEQKEEELQKQKEGQQLKAKKLKSVISLSQMVPTIEKKADVTSLTEKKPVQSEKIRPWKSIDKWHVEEQKDEKDAFEEPVALKDREFSKLLDICSEQNIQPRPIELHRQSFGKRIDQRLHELSWPFQKIIQNIEIIGLIVTAGWNFFGGVYTIPTNIAIFSWAIVLETKTTVVFWLFLMSYAFTILACKLSLAYLPDVDFIDFLFYYHPHDYLYEFLIILISAIQIVFLKMGGTSQIAYSQRENIYDAFYRSMLNEASKGKEQQKEEGFLKIYTKMRHANKHSFFYRVFSKGRIKPGKDFYPMLAIVQVVILFYIFFFYDMMEFESKNNRKSLGEILTVTQFSKNMILALFFQVIIMIVDRVIVALNLIDPLNQRLQNFFFSFAFKFSQKYTSLSVEQLAQLGRFDYLLIIKYVFHAFLLISINFFVYLYIPSGGFQKSLIPQCQLSVCGKSYNYLSFFLFLYLIYFVISGLQIKHGFNRNKCRNTLMQRYHWKNYYTYLFFTGIPFLWEFKKISDWTTTATALPLFHWMKFQDINARMYRSKCQAEILRTKQLGLTPWYKYLVGPLGFFFILALIFSPIVMYSSFNPFAVKDSIIAASSRLELVMNQNIEYDFFSTSHIKIIDQNSMQDKHKLIGYFDRANLYKLDATSYPDQDFPLSEPALQQLIEHINQTVLKEKNFTFEFRLIIGISEKIGGDTSTLWGSKTLSDEQIASLLAVITSGAENLTIQNFYSPLPGQLENRTLYIFNRNEGQYFEVCTTPMTQATQNKTQTYQGIFIFYKSSVKYKAAIGLLTFYLTYVVLINSLFRVYLTGGTQTIIFEGPQLQKILFLCEAVRSARILQNFYQEEYLYFSLVDLMRHPRMIKDIADDFSNLRKIKHLKQE